MTPEEIDYLGRRERQERTAARQSYITARQARKRLAHFYAARLDGLTSYEPFGAVPAGTPLNHS
jgi:hypothetical protein